MRSNFFEIYGDVVDEFERKTNRKYSILVGLAVDSFNHKVVLMNRFATTFDDYRDVKRLIPFATKPDEIYKILKDMLKELEGENYVDPDAEVSEPVSELLLVTVDISVNEDEPCIKVGKSVGTGCCREIKIVNTITGDEAIELYKKLVGG